MTTRYKTAVFHLKGEPVDRYQDTTKFECFPISRPLAAVLRGQKFAGAIITSGADHVLSMEMNKGDAQALRSAIQGSVLANDGTVTVKK